MTGPLTNFLSSFVHRSRLSPSIRGGGRRTRTSSTRTNEVAFTLIEVLVVITLISLIAVLLLPVLGRAKAKGRQIHCLNLQRQWATAFRLYVDEHEDLIPREGYERLGDVRLNNWNQVKGKPIAPNQTDSDDVWYNALPYYLSVSRAAAYAPVDKHEDFYSSQSLFHCPSAQIPTHATKPTYVFALFSIAMNSQLIEFPRGPTISFNALVPEASRTVLFLDNLLDGESKVHPAQENFDLGQPAAYADRFSARHSRGGNLAFADGHVAWHAGAKVVETNPESPLRGGPIMPPVDIVWESEYEFVESVESLIR
jgi:prepilin-type processing-associated H-X9-DG protein